MNHHSHMYKAVIDYENCLELFLCHDNLGNWTMGKRDNGSMGKREKKGKRDNGTIGQRDKGIE